MTDPADLATVLAAAGIDARARGGGPVMVVARRRDALLWANDAAWAFFGGLDEARAAHLLFRSSTAASAFASRLRGMKAGQQDHLERLRLGREWAAVPLLVTCKAVDRDAPEPLAVLRWVAPSARPEPRSGEEVGPLSALLQEQSGRATEVEPIRAPTHAEPSPRWRLLWATDRDGVVTEVGTGFARLAGRSALALGDHLPSRLRAVDPSLAERVERILTHGGALAKSRLAWPCEGREPLPMEAGFARRRGSGGGLGGFFLVEGTAPVSGVNEDEVGKAGDLETARDDAVAPIPPFVASRDPTAGASPDESIAAPVRSVFTTRPAEAHLTFVAASAGQGGNVVHFPAMRIASVPANFGPEMRSAPIVPPRPPADDQVPETLETPRWSEAPEPEPGTRHLSADEQDAFRQIGQVLGTKPSGMRSYPAGAGAAMLGPGTAGPGAVESFAAILDALPLGLVWQIDGQTHANAAFRTRAGFATEFLPDDLVPEDDAADVAFTGLEGQRLAARARSLTVHGRPMRLFVLSDSPPSEQPEQAPAPDRSTIVSAPPAGDALWGSDLSALGIAADGHALLADDGTITSASPGAVGLFGYEPSDLVGRSIADLASPETRDEWQALLAVESHGVSVHDLVGRSRAGHLVPLTVRAGRIAANAVFVAWTDNAQRQRAMTGLEAARREAERTSALKSDFLAKVCHEIRTPLNAMLGFAEVIRDERIGPVGNSRYLEYTKDIHASGTHVLSLVNDLLDLSRIEAGRMDLRLEAVDANAIVNACVNSLQTQAHRERIIMRLSLTPGLPAALADERSVRQIVLNLLSNAIKFNEPGGQVIVSTALIETDMLAIRVRDTGIGMTDDEIETAMEPFRQVSTVKRTGSGLGLPVTKALVEANCASMAIRSTPGQGTLVEVTFPVVERNSMSLPAE